MKLRSILAAAVLATTAAVVPATAAHATTGYCTSPVVKGTPTTIKIAGVTAATLYLKYCSSRRTAYGELDISTAWYNAGHRGWNVQLVLENQGYTYPTVTWTNTSEKAFFTQEGLETDQSPFYPYWFYATWDVYVSVWKYNTCSSSGAPSSDSYNIHTNTVSGGHINRVCS